ncbi:alpha/beta hydrolase-fold protein [Rhodococcus qingshengii]
MTNLGFSRLASSSPRLARFRDELADDPSAAVTSLLADAEAAQGPIVEPSADAHPGNEFLVTFVHVDDVDHVELNTQALMLSVPRQSEPMIREPGTNVWTLVVRVASGITTAYRYQVDPPSLGGTTDDMIAKLSDPEQYNAFAAAYARSIRPDRHNPRRVHDSMSGSSEPLNCVLVMPGAPDTLAEGDLEGKIEEHALPSGRRVDVYQPAKSGEDFPLVVMLDGEYCRSGRILEHLDAAIAAGQVPPVRVVLWHNLSPTSRMVEMACNPALPTALANELFPWLDHRDELPPVEQRVLAGFSYGGLATAFVIMHRPDLFGSAMPISASFFYTPDPATEPGEWLARQVTPGNSAQARWFLAVGQLEDTVISLPGLEPGATMVSGVRHFRDVLVTAGADVTDLLEYPSGHEMFTVRAALERGLPALLGASPIP